MSTPFRECPACGAHLDAGERCECAEATAAAERAGAESARVIPQSAAYYGTHGGITYQPERNAEIGVRPPWRPQYE